MSIQPLPALPFTVIISANTLPADVSHGTDLNILIEAGIITLVGPNGSGKTSTLRSLRDVLRNLYGQSIVRFISAGRMGVLEGFRSNTHGTGPGNPDDTTTGDQNNIRYRKQSETVTGDFLALQERSDIKLKVESRLQGIFGKTIILTWSQNGLKIHFRSINSKSQSYGAGAEASGLTQLVALLAALYDDEIKFLLIDEPEVSLHPQLQSFLLEEIKSVSGDPTQAGKKVIIISTHSPSMLPLRAIDDLKSIIFFPDKGKTPVQIQGANPILLDASMESLAIRLNELYKIALFSKSVLLSEGVSDSIILGTLTGKYDENFSSNGGQLVSVSGKGELIAADKLFSFAKKHVCVLADLDVLDNGDLIGYVDSKHPPGIAIGPHPNLLTHYQNCDHALSQLVTNNWADINGNVIGMSYFKAGGGIVHNKRAALQFLIITPTAQILALPNGAAWNTVATDYISLLDVLDLQGFVLIRKGTIEDCYISAPVASSKPMAAAIESTALKAALTTIISPSYTDVIKAISFIKQSPKVDEMILLREKLGSLLGTIWANMNDGVTDDEIQSIVDQSEKGLSNIFRVTKRMNGAAPELNIEIISPLFANYVSPFQHQQADSIMTLQNLLRKK